ncbi:hypothetical protein NIES37_39740 [Tolypothrix tenuis PCC 7101]|uniref:Uncharacterized protein n=1 Tax=Tolypothrix tenuis PCC 7101 TaxID=231146 RepID=A0A1Z4N2X9_9CYAN|nr:hypothetical protein [Aulosira sp. FACHB-113]BAY99991.1 hypothetical protein NIES37_39740 [Tolypothrix tenuis PCC 7101]BAZ76087.1 hypothetical protein NIES50_46850 [Aulosira laxa NIES-50]
MAILDSESAQKNRLRFLNRASKSVSTGDALALFALGTFGLHLITFFILLLLYGSYSQLNKKAPPSLVQLETGKSIKVAPIGSLERTPQVILRFVSDTMTLMMNWSGTLPPSTVEEAAKPKPDPGVNISNREFRSSKITSAAWQASYALSEDFRKEFLKALAAITPSGVFQGKTQVVLVPLSIQSPIKIAEGKWKVKMVANLTIVAQDSNLGETIQFNKEIFVRAVVPPESPNQVDGLAAVIYQMRASGLEIYAIRDLAQENL